MKTLRHLLAAALILPSAAGVHAQNSDMTALMTEGEVRKVDPEAGKVTLRHGPIANLDMPGMTMVFTATDPKMLEKLKEGDKVRFSADRVNGALAVTRIDAVK